MTKICPNLSNFTEDFREIKVRKHFDKFFMPKTYVMEVKWTGQNIPTPTTYSKQSSR
jgi:hypothetical protein